MIVSKIQDISKKESKVYYLENFSATAVYSIMGEEKLGKIDFSIEHKPTGEMLVKVELIDKLDYPSLKVLMELKTQIRSLYQKNLLP